MKIQMKKDVILAPLDKFTIVIMGGNNIYYRSQSRGPSGAVHHYHTENNVVKTIIPERNELVDKHWRQ